MEIFDEIWGSLRRNKMRTVLTGFAVSWGLFMIIALLGAGTGLLNAMSSRYPDQCHHRLSGLQEHPL